MADVKGMLKVVDATCSGIYGDYRKLAKYFTVGIFGTIVDWAVYAILIVFGDVYFQIAMAISYFIGMIINYSLNRRFTFNSTYKKVHYQFFSFAVIAIIGFGIQELLAAGLVSYVFSNTTADLPLMITRVIATFVGFIWTFIANKRVTFKIFQ